MRYILFKKMEYSDENMFAAYFRQIPGEQWKDTEGKKFMIQFVAECETPKQVISHVQKDSAAKFILFRGDVEELNCAVPVMCGGRVFSTMEAEWGDKPEPKKPTKPKKETNAKHPIILTETEVTGDAPPPTGDTSNGGS